MIYIETFGVCFLVIFIVGTWSYRMGFKDACISRGVPKMDNPPPPPEKINVKSGYQPVKAIESKPPTGGSGVPDKLYYNANHWFEAPVIKKIDQ